ASARACTTGIACTTSPSAPSRTSSTDGIALRAILVRPGNLPDDLAGVMILGVADNRRASTVAAHGLALRNGVDRVVGALAVHVGAQRLEQRRHRVVVEEDDGVDAAQGVHEFGPLEARHDG